MEAIRPFGTVGVRHLHGNMQAPLSWKARNALRWEFIWGYVANEMAKAFSRLTGIPTIISELRGVKRYANGVREDYGVLGRRVVTDVCVAFMVDNFAGTTDLDTMKYHGVGTGTGNEAAADTYTSLTECTTETNPDNTRATGSTIEGATANIYRTVGTVAFDGTVAVTSHGVLSQAAVGGGTLLDRTKFAAINVVSGDSIEFTYSLVFTSGG
jgi:hypothetical protein